MRPQNRWRNEPQSEKALTVLQCVQSGLKTSRAIADSTGLTVAYCAHMLFVWAQFGKIKRGSIQHVGPKRVHQIVWELP